MNSNRSHWVDFARGAADPRSVAWGVALGVLAGMVTGWNLTLATIVTTVLILNVHTRTFLLAWAAGLGLRWLLAGAAFRIGIIALDRTPLGEAIAMLGDGPVLALWDWDRYMLVGGVILGLLNGLPAAHFAARLTRRLQSSAANGEANLNDMPKWLRTSGSLLLGRKSLVPPGESSPWLRPSGLLAAPIAPIAIVIGVHMLGPRLMRHTLEEHLTALNGAEVSVGICRISLADGRFELADVAMADPEDLRTDRLRVGRVIGRLEPGALLRGQIDVEHLDVRLVRTDIARRKAADAADRSAPPVFRSIAPREVKMSDAMASVDEAGQLRVDGFLRCASSLKQQAARLQALVAELERLALIDASAESTAPLSGNLGALWAQRSTLGAAPTALRIATMRVEDLPVEWQLGDRAKLELANVSTSLWTSDRPTRIQVVAPRGPVELAVDLSPPDPAARHRIELRACGVEVVDLVDVTSSRQRCDSRSGVLVIQGEGWIDRQGIELPLSIEADSLDVRFLGPQTVAGLPASVWNEGLAYLATFRSRATLVGPWHAPKLCVDRLGVVEQFKHQLRAAGQHELVATIELSTVPPHRIAHSGHPVDVSTSSPSPESTSVADSDAKASGEPQSRYPTIAENKRSNVTGRFGTNSVEPDDQQSKTNDFALADVPALPVATADPSVLPPIPQAPRPRLATPAASATESGSYTFTPGADMAEALRSDRRSSIPGPRNFDVGHEVRPIEPVREPIVHATGDPPQESMTIEISPSQPQPQIVAARPSPTLVTIESNDADSWAALSAEPPAPPTNVEIEEPAYGGQSPAYPQQQQTVTQFFRKWWPWARRRDDRSLDEALPPMGFENRWAAQDRIDDSSPVMDNGPGDWPPAWQDEYQATRPEPSAPARWFNRLRR